MKPIQPLLLLMLSIALLLYLRFLSSQLWGRIVVLLGFFAGATLIMAPQQANRLAALFGVGRGADLLLYIGIAVVLQLLIRIFVTLRSHERQLTLLSRHVALHEASSPEPKD